MSTLARPVAFVMVAPWTRRWWCLWWARARGGQTVAAMVAEARRGRGWQVRSAELASDAGFVAIGVDSEQWRRWSTWCGMRGLTLPKPSRCPVGFMPSREPPR